MHVTKKVLFFQSKMDTSADWRLQLLTSLNRKQPDTVDQIAKGSVLAREDLP